MKFIKDKIILSGSYLCFCINKKDVKSVNTLPICINISNSADDRHQLQHQNPIDLN